MPVEGEACAPTSKYIPIINLFFIIYTIRYSRFIMNQDAENNFYTNRFIL